MFLRLCVFRFSVSDESYGNADGRNYKTDYSSQLILYQRVDHIASKALSSLIGHADS